MNQVKKQEDVVQALQAEAKSNAVFKDVCYVFAMRKRARFQVTIDSLHIRMQSEGFKHTKTDLEKVLRFLANLGLGVLSVDSKNHLRALVNIKMTLQSIGQVALASAQDLSKYRKQNRFQKLDAPAPEVEPPKAITPLPKRNDVYPMFLTIMIDGKPIELPKAQIRSSDLGEFLANFTSLTKAGDV